MEPDITTTEQLEDTIAHYCTGLKLDWNECAEFCLAILTYLQVGEHLVDPDQSEAIRIARSIHLRDGSAIGLVARIMAEAAEVEHDYYQHMDARARR